MLTLIKKDIMTSLRIRSIKDIVITVLICLVIFNIMIFILPVSSGDIILLGSIITYVIVMNSFYYDSKDKSERFMTSLPIKREDIVYSKYIFTLITLIISIVITYLIYSGIIYEPDRVIVFEDLVLIVITVLISMSIIMPSIFKFGYSKVRIFAPIVTILIGYISYQKIDFNRYLNYGSSNLFLEFSKKISKIIYGLFNFKIDEFQKLTISTSLILISVISIIIFIASMYLSIKIYKKRNIA